MATCAGQLNAKKKRTHPKRIQCIIHTERTGRANGTEDTRDMAENYNCGRLRAGSAPSTSTKPSCASASASWVGTRRRTSATHSGK